MKKAALLLLLLPLFAPAKDRAPFYYELRIYHLADDADEASVDRYLENAFLPALHRAGISNVGVFKPVHEDTINDHRIYVLIAYPSIAALESTSASLARDRAYQDAGKAYLDADYSDPPYSRIETILLKAFSGSPALELPKLNSTKQDRVYELRSYEGGTEKLYRRKVKMFNDGNEIGLFKRLNFNAIFYGEVLSGSRMPNLMYMTSFENKADRDAHWKQFGESSEWKALVGMPEYQHTVSKSDIFLLHPTSYSDY